MKLSNVKNEMPYSLKFNGSEKTKFYLLTSKSNEDEDDQIETFCYSNNKTKTIFLETPHRFWSYFSLDGKRVENIKIDNDSYEPVDKKLQESAKIKQNLTIVTGYFE